MKVCVLFLFLISLPALGGWSQKARSFLPKKVALIEPGKTDREGARKLLGKPDLVKGGKEYWVVDGFKFAVELSYQENKVSSLHYNFPEKKFGLEALKGGVDPKLLKRSPVSPHTSLVYEDAEGKMEVELTSGQVESVRFP